MGSVYINVLRSLIGGKLTQRGIGGGTSSSVAGSDRDGIAHALWEAADVQRQGGRASWKDFHASNLLPRHISDSN